MLSRFLFDFDAIKTFLHLLDIHVKRSQANSHENFKTEKLYK